MVAVTCLTTLVYNKNMPRVSDKHLLITQFLEMLARENEEQAQEKMLEQFEQSLEHLDEHQLRYYRVLLRRLRQLGMIVIAQFHVVRNLHPKAIVRSVWRV